jgi:hypothetical protein
MDKSLYYSPDKMLSYNRILNFVIGARGVGKSYGMKKYVVKQFIKTGKQFMYVRRYKDDLKKITTFFNDIGAEFPEHELKVKGKEFYVNGKLAGYAIALSSWQSLKSNAYPEVSTILYDEFLREKDNSTYIPNEPRALLNLMDTVFRNRTDVRTICMANSTTIVNPFFLYFNIIPNLKKRYNAWESVLVEIPDSKDFSDARRETRFGKLIANTEYGEMSLDNEFTEDSETFIEKRSKESQFVFSVLYKNNTFGIWVDTKKGLMYLANEHDPSSKYVFAMTSEDHSENAMMLTGWKKNYQLKKLVGSFMNGYLRFDNQVVRNLAYEMFRKMNVV